jgi:hypothetical protein
MKLALLLLSITSSYAIELSDYLNKNNCDQIIDKQVFTVCYDYKMKGAKLVSYTLEAIKEKVLRESSLERSIIYRVLISIRMM